MSINNKQDIIVNIENNIEHYSPNHIEYNKRDHHNSRGHRSDYLRIERISKAKIILGNGFDLACGLQSSYSSFFDSRSTQYGEIEKYFNNEIESLPDDISIWDLVFVNLKMNYSSFKDSKTVSWKDVETVMKLVLGFKIPDIVSPKINLNNICKCINGDSIELSQDEIKIKGYIVNKIAKDETPYKFIYKELNQFEKVFSKYIKSQMNDEYNEKARKMFTEEGYLNIDADDINSIDTFNYTTPDIFRELQAKNKHIAIRHINGMIFDPAKDDVETTAIFGIDAQDIELNDERYIFTKNFRKMRRLIDGGREQHNRSFSNVIVYGHSLSEADYSYFFSIMSNLELSKYNVYDKRFVVAFSDYDKDARENVVWSTIRLIVAFDKWVNPDSNRHGLVEVLETSDRLSFIPVKGFKEIK